jgi:hypothetical protein
VIAAPPVLVGAVNEIVAVPAECVRAVIVGAVAVVAATNDADAAEAALVPNVFVDVTVHV